ncbi:MAG TPA: outer membrane beta-barrel protein [Cytophagales bacterium]|nr:outer membrane beta-barrel protein [Cytophagales bacterium]
MKHTLYITLGLAIASFPAFAKTSQDSAAAAAPAPGKMTMSGYVDNYYIYNLNSPQNMTNIGVNGYERAFEKNSGQFNLGLAQTKFTYTNDRSEAVIDLTFGPNADWGNYGNAPSAFYSKAVGYTVFSGISIKQAYYTYKATSKLSFTAGQFGTHIGYEVIDAPVNLNYSLSNLFNNGPFYHTGLKSTYAISDKMSIMAGVVNNWDAMYDNNKFKTFIAQYYISPMEGWNLYVNYIGGIETDMYDPATGNVSSSYGTEPQRGAKHLFDLTTGYQITDNFYLGLNAAYGFSTRNRNTEDTSKFDQNLGWGGVALYSNYKISDMINIGARVEYFDNTNGVQYLKSSRGTGTDVTSITITPTFTLANGNFLLKPEFRYDIYNKLEAFGGEDVNLIQQFEDSDGKFSKNTLPTIGLIGIYKF